MKIPDKLTFATSTIADGNMGFKFGEKNEVVQNRERFLNKPNVAVNRYICMSCSHGDMIKLVDSETHKQHLNAKAPEDMLEAEVLVTQEPNLALMLLTADCLPTGFYDPITQTIALAHFSRQTIADGLPEKTVSFLRQTLNVDPANLQVFVGPHIHQQSYSFPLPLEKTPSDKIAPFLSEVNNHAYIDLAAAHNSQLTEAGVLEDNIQLNETNTYSSPDHFSHFESMRDNQKPQGRLATVLMLKV